MNSISRASLDSALSSAVRLLDDDPAAAAQCARELLSQAPGNPDVSLLLGMACNVGGDFAQASAVLQELVRMHSHAHAPLLELARAQMGLRRFDDAAATLKHLLALKPDWSLAHLALANLRYADGDANGADASYLDYLRHTSNDRELMAATTVLARNQLPDAERMLRLRLRRWPTDVAAMRLQAELCMRTRRNDEAICLLEEALRRAPGFDAARQNYAVALNRSGRHAEALAELDTLLEMRPDDQILHDMKAVILGRLGDVEDAIATYERLLQRKEGHPNIWIGYGNALKTSGRTKDAVSAYRRALELQPGSGGAWWSLANLKTVRFDASDIAAMRGQLRRNDLDETTRANFEFSLGKALEDARQDEEAFSHYAQGNALRRRQAPYDATVNRANMRRACAIHTREFFAARQGAGCDARDPIFVLGMPRSGSTLIEQILSSHPAVEGTAELTAVVAIAHELGQRAAQPGVAAYQDALTSLEGAQLRALGERYLERTRSQRRTDAPFFIDKMPNNFAHVGLIHLILPNAKIVDTRRHPMACCFSNFKQNFTRGQEFSYDLADMGHYYRDYVSLMAHYDRVLPGRIHRVIYEEVVADTEAQVRSLLDYCGLPFDERCLRFFENDRAVRTASSEQVRRPIYREGLDLWQRFEPWLEPLADALGPVLTLYPQVPPDLLASA
ncbi:MAG: sulfotransferase [Lysobacteraceae bacterium]